MIRPHIRQIAADILSRIDEDAAYSNILLGKLAKDKNISAEEFPVIQKMVRGVLETRNSLDETLDALLSDKGNRTPTFIRNLLRIALYQLQFLDRVPPHAVVNESVEVTKKSQYSKLSGLVNGVLRTSIREAAARKKDAPPESVQAEQERSAFNHPSWMVERWKKEFGEAEALKICQANNTDWSVFLRVNTLKTSLEELQGELLKEGVVTEPSRYAKQCLVVRSLPKKVRLHELQAYLAGDFFIQDQSSILVTELVNAQPGERVLDLCSAPGGKTCSLGLQMAGQGLLVAAEISEKRLKLVEENCRRLGLTNVEYRVEDGRRLMNQELFDSVLVDAPCSGLGVIGRRSDARWSKREEEITELGVLQKDLLQNAATLVRPGGRLVYSTCSIEKAENEEIADWFLSGNTGFSKGATPEDVHPEILTEHGYLRTWPHRHRMGGAFGAVFVKEN